MKLLQLLLPRQNNSQRLLHLQVPKPPRNLQLQVLQVPPRMCLALRRLTPFQLPKANPLQPAWHGSLQQ